MIVVFATFIGDDHRIRAGERCRIKLMATHTGMTLAYIEASEHGDDGPPWYHVASVPYSLVGFLTNWQHVDRAIEVET